MTSFLAVTAVLYERDAKTHLVQMVHILRAETKDEASEHVERWLDETYPEPGYFGHEYEVNELPGVIIEGENASYEYAVSETPIIITKSERT